MNSLRLELITYLSLALRLVLPSLALRWVCSDVLRFGSRFLTIAGALTEQLQFFLRISIAYHFGSASYCVVRSFNLVSGLQLVRFSHSGYDFAIHGWLSLALVFV